MNRDPSVIRVLGDLERLGCRGSERNVLGRFFTLEYRLVCPYGMIVLKIVNVLPDRRTTPQ